MRTTFKTVSTPTVTGYTEGASVQPAIPSAYNKMITRTIVVLIATLFGVSVLAAFVDLIERLKILLKNHLFST